MEKIFRPSCLLTAALRQNTFYYFFARPRPFSGICVFKAFVVVFLSDDFYKNEDDDDDYDEFVDDNDPNFWGKEGSTLSKLLDEDSLGQLNAVHSKYHQLKCQLHATRKS